MAADLAATPPPALQVQLCGDAHLSNFGALASPEWRLFFDLNDFDETLPGPFEYDVKWLAASFMVAGRNNGFGKAEARWPSGRGGGRVHPECRHLPRRAVPVLVALAAVGPAAAVVGFIGAFFALPIAAVIQAFLSTYSRRYDIIESDLTRWTSRGSAEDV
jgi:Uncharacterized protein conserved in bacteria (DUF2252)